MTSYTLSPDAVTVLAAVVIALLTTIALVVRLLDDARARLVRRGRVKEMLDQMALADRVNHRINVRRFLSKP